MKSCCGKYAVNKQAVEADEEFQHVQSLCPLAKPGLFSSQAKPEDRAAFLQFAKRSLVVTISIVQGTSENQGRPRSIGTGCLFQSLA